MPSIEPVKETDITKLVEMAREKVSNDKVIAWIIERSPKWKSDGYNEIMKALKEADIELK